MAAAAFTATLREVFRSGHAAFLEGLRHVGVHFRGDLLQGLLGSIEGADEFVRIGTLLEFLESADLRLRDGFATAVALFQRIAHADDFAVEGQGRLICEEGFCVLAGCEDFRVSSDGLAEILEGLLDGWGEGIGHGVGRLHRKITLASANEVHLRRGRSVREYPMSPLALIAEQLIQDAVENGEPEKLAQSGHRVNLDDYFAAPASLRAGFSLLKNAGVNPPELEAISEVDRLRQEVSKCQDPVKLQKLRMRLVTRETEMIMGLERVKQAIKADATL